MLKVSSTVIDACLQTAVKILNNPLDWLLRKVVPDVLQTRVHSNSWIHIALQ